MSKADYLCCAKCYSKIVYSDDDAVAYCAECYDRLKGDGMFSDKDIVDWLASDRDNFTEVEYRIKSFDDSFRDACSRHMKDEIGWDMDDKNYGVTEDMIK